MFTVVFGDCHHKLDNANLSGKDLNDDFLNIYGHCPSSHSQVFQFTVRCCVQCYVTNVIDLTNKVSSRLVLSEHINFIRV